MRLNNRNKYPCQNSAIIKDMFSCSTENFVVAENAFFQMNVVAEKHHYRKSEKWQTAFKRTLVIVISFLFFTSYSRNQHVVSKGSTTSRNDSIPNPTILTCNQDGELIFKECGGVRAEISDWKVEGIRVRVDSFTITIAKISGDTVVIKNYGAHYQAAAMGAFSALNIGDWISLSDFIVTVENEVAPRKLTKVFSSVYSGKKFDFRH